MLQTFAFKPAFSKLEHYITYSIGLDKKWREKKQKHNNKKTLQEAEAAVLQVTNAHTEGRGEGSRACGRWHAGHWIFPNFR